MSTKAHIVLVIGLTFAGCSRSQDAAGREQEAKATGPAAAAPAGDMSSMGDMSGMDHAAMAQDAPVSGPGEARTSPTAPISGMAGTDHAQMTVPAAGQAPERERSQAPVTDHSRMAGMQMPPSGPEQPGTEELLTLVSELVKDPVVRREIEADSALRAAWADTAVSRTILRPR